jgi:hypothetical protein
MSARRLKSAQTAVMLACIKTTDKGPETLPPVHYRSFTA